MRDEEAATQLCVYTGIGCLRSPFFFSYIGEPEEPKGSAGLLNLHPAFSSDSQATMKFAPGF